MVCISSSRNAPERHRRSDLMGSIPLFSVHPVGSLLSGPVEPRGFENITVMGSIPRFSAHPISPLLSGAVEPRGFEGIVVMPPSSRGHPSCHWQLD